MLTRLSTIKFYILYAIMFGGKTTTTGFFIFTRTYIKNVINSDKIRK